MDNIDWNFIRKQEGNKLVGSVPDAENSDSGVTIASGFDLGARNENDLSGLPDDIIALLKPFLGFKGAEAKEIAKNLKVSKEQADIINKFSHKEAYDNLSAKWEKATGSSFSDLPVNKATVIASVAFQYGDLESKTPNFWSQVTSDDWDGAVSNLRNFGDRYSSRRKREADFFESDISKKKLAPEQTFLSPDDAMLQEVVLPDAVGKATVLSEPEEGSFEAIFGVDMYGAKAEDSFAVPDDFSPSQEVKDRAQAERDLEASVIKEHDFNLKVQAEKEISKGSQFNFIGKERYGERIGPYPDESHFDYSMFAPTESQAFMAAFKQYNVMPSLSRMFSDTVNPKMGNVEGYSVYNDNRLKQIVGEDNLYFFRHEGSHQQAIQKWNRMNEDHKDAQTVAASRSGVGYSIASGLMDPSILMPILPAKLSGASRLRRFARGASLGYLTTAPQQVIIETQNESRDASNAMLAVGAAGILGGAIALKFGRASTPAEIARIRLEENNFRVNVLGKESKYTAKELKQFKAIQSAGASISPEIARTNAYKQLELEQMAETGFGLENLGWNPVMRMFKSSNPIVAGLAPEMVDVGGLIQKKVHQGIEMKQSVETTFRVTYYPDLVDAVRSADVAYLKYRNVFSSSSDAVRALQMTKIQAKDSIKNLFARGDGSLTEVQFRNRVGMAMRRGDIDPITDAATPFVNQVAKSYRKVFEKIKKEANSVRLFEREFAKDLAKAKQANNVPLVAALEEKIKLLRENGVTVNTALSYVPRIYRIDRIEQNIPRFLRTIKDWAMKTKGMSAKEADAFSAEILDTVTRRRPFIDFEHSTDALDWIKNPSGAQARSLEIPDELIEDFLENDIESLLRTHVKTMGMDIELTRKFGSADMQDVIQQVTDEYKSLIKSTSDYNERAKLSAGLQNDLRDIRGLRDRLRGTYGASKDPHAMSSRFIRTMKSINVLTGMGSAMVSSIPDVARIFMVEGFVNAYGKGFATLFDKQAMTIRRMAKPELDRAAVAVDAVLGLRAHAMSDVGDLFGNRYTIERSLNEATGMFFLMNGLNIWNQALKEMAGNVTVLRMTDSLMRKGGWNNLSRVEKEKLLKNGIGQHDYGIMRQQIKRFGQKEQGQWLPNTEAWTDTTMRLRFRNALNQNVERIIVTPGAGDRALWTSTEMGSFLTQFKSYGQGAMQRMLTAGLQEKDAAFWQGAFLIVGLAAMVNEIKRAQYGMDSYESFDQKLINAIDRSGLLGWFTDVNNSIEKMSDYQLGMRPFLTDQPSYPVHSTAKAGAIFGPSASAGLNATSVLGDVLTGTADAKTGSDLRFIFPTGNLFYLDPVYDGIFGEGNVNRQETKNER